MSATQLTHAPTAQATPRAAKALLRIESMWQIPGCMRGTHAPVAFVRLALGDSVHWTGIVERAAALLEPHIPGCTSKTGLRSRTKTPAGVPEHDALFLARLMTLLGALSVQIGLPALDAPQAMALGRPRDGVARWLLMLPGYSPRAAALAMAWLVRWINDLSRAGESLAWTSERRAELNSLLDKLNRLAPLGNNARHFVRTAHERGIPWIVLPSGIVQYGWGKRARWLNSTFTDGTPNLAARMARDKQSGNALLRQAGIPVPEQRLVKTVEAALEAAQSLGYPVVVKPANLDGGHGVSAGLTTPEVVRSAFERAARYSRDILIERHVEGRDYRIIVGHGRVLWAIERVPAGVTGDGEHSVRELIERTNRDPRRGTRRWAQMKPLQVDEEAQGLLDEQGVTLDAVPPAGQVVRLRRAANISSGGTPVPVTDIMHPDNATLAVRAARVMRLDIAGVDLLAPDITRSWRETGAAICEVNGQPQLSITAPQIYGQLFDTLVAGKGRIATALVLSTGDADDAVRECTRIMNDRGVCVGLSTAAGLSIAGKRIRGGRASPFADVRSLLIDPAVEAVVLVADGREFLSAGLPFDRFDVLAIADWESAVQGNGSTDRAPLPRVLDLVKSHCSGEALICRDHPQVQLVASRLGERRVETVSARAHLGVRLAQALLRRHASHGRPADKSASSKLRRLRPIKDSLAS